MVEEQKEILAACGCLDLKPTIGEVVDIVARLHVRIACEAVDRPRDVGCDERVEDVAVAVAAKLTAIIEAAEPDAVVRMLRIIGGRMKNGEFEGVGLSGAEGAVRCYVHESMSKAVGDEFQAHLGVIHASKRNQDRARRGYPNLRATMEKFGVSNGDVAEACGMQNAATARERINGRGRTFSAEEMCRIHSECFGNAAVDPLELFSIDWSGEEWRSMRETAERAMEATSYLAGGYVDAILGMPKWTEDTFSAWLDETGYDRRRFLEWTPDNGINPWTNYVRWCERTGRSRWALSADEFSDAACKRFGLERQGFFKSEKSGVMYERFVEKS